MEAVSRVKDTYKEMCSAEEKRISYRGMRNKVEKPFSKAIREKTQ